MAVVTAAVVVGAGMTAYGASQNRKAQRSANEANLEQQRRAMVFQKEQEVLAIGATEDALASSYQAQRGMAERITGRGIQTRGDMMAQAAQAGWGAGSTVSLGMQRGGVMDEKNVLASLASTMEQQRGNIRLAQASIYSGQDFPMIQTTAQMDDSWARAGGQILGAGVSAGIEKWG